MRHRISSFSCHPFPPAATLSFVALLFQTSLVGTLDEAQRVAALFEQHSKVLETAELEQRVTQLEERWAREFEAEN